MDIPILATKLYIPPPPRIGVLRPRLVERLNGGLHRKLTLISAPAGFGKTSLISEWAASYARAEPEVGKPPVRSAAWLSLDEADSNPIRFFTYFVAAVRMVAPDFGEGVLGIVRSNQQVSVEPILNALLNELAAVPRSFALVLDDYHRIDSKAIDEALTYLIEHLPPQMHLVITTREDPQLPLARLRARDQLTELRAADLRFTPSEAASFLEGMGIKLAPEDVSLLEDRTEGWIAGLQLAALAVQGLSTQGRQDVTGFIQAFNGDHRYIMDYLVEEVLQRQPETTRSFLLQTAILDQLTGPLCDAVTGQANGSARLEALQRGNFFVIPLDDKRQWYRYHHLFAEVLHAYLTAEQPDQLAVLHRRASAWFEQHGQAGDAIRHALAAEDFALAAGMIEQIFPAMARARQEDTMLGWLRSLPESVVQERPVLCNFYAGVLLQHGMMENVEAWLRAAELGLEPAAARTVTNEAEFRRLPGAVAIHRSGLALMVGNIADTIKYARQALDLAPEDDLLGRGGAAGLLGLALWTGGSLEEAQQIFSEGILYLQKAGHFSDAIGLTLARSEIFITQGRLHAAMQLYERVLQAAAELGTPAVRGTADMLVGLSELYRERGNLTAAEQHLQRSKELGEHAGLPQNRYRWLAAMALIREAEGDLAGALELLEAAERVYAGDFSPNVRPIAAMKARVWAAQGRFVEALDWARGVKLSAGDDLSYLREYDHITLARILFARYRSERSEQILQEAAGLMERLLKAAEAGGRAGSVIELHVLLALAHQAQGDMDAALSHLQQALTLAEPKGYLRVFVDEGLPMEHLLGKAAAVGIKTGYTGRLLAAFEDDQQSRTGEAPRLTFPTMHEVRQADKKPGAPVGPPAKDELMEPLSERELEVLRLFGTELSGPEIAQELVIALSTVRTHTKNIYSKLNVNSRRAAVKRAAELHLI